MSGRKPTASYVAFIRGQVDGISLAINMLTTIAFWNSQSLQDVSGESVEKSLTYLRDAYMKSLSKAEMERAAK